MTTIHYDLYRRDIKNNFHRIYKEQDLVTARANLTLELSDPNDKGRWTVKEVKTIIEVKELSLISFLR